MTPPSDAVISAFARASERPRPTFPLVLAAVTIATLAMALDRIHHFSEGAFVLGVALTAVLATATGKVVDGLRGQPRWRTAAAVALPAAFGALIGVAIQTSLLVDVRGASLTPLRDLGGLVDTTEGTSWIAGGIVLGGVPALLVSAFLLLAARALRRLVGHDAPEGFAVAFTGASGVVAGLGSLCVDGVALAPLYVVAAASALTLLVTLLVDSSRIRFLQSAFSSTEGLEVIAAAHFAGDASLVPVIASATSEAVLVRTLGNAGGRGGLRASYRSAAVEPIARIPSTEMQALLPIRKRRRAAIALLCATCAFVGAGLIVHAGPGLY